MKSTIVVTLLSILLTSCTIYKDIEVKEVRGVRITKFTDKGIEAEVDLRIFNPNNYKVSLVSVDADLYVNDKDVGDAKLNKRVTLGKKSNEVHTVKLEGDYSDMGGGLLETLIGTLFARSINFRVDGTMKGKALFVGKSFYFQVDQDVRL